MKQSHKLTLLWRKPKQRPKPRAHLRRSILALMTTSRRLPHQDQLYLLDPVNAHRTELRVTLWADLSPKDRLKV